MEVNCYIRLEAIVELPMVHSVLSPELDVVAVGIIVRGQLSLKVEDAVGVVTRKNSNFELLQQRGSPLLVGVECSKEREGRFITGGFIAVNACFRVREQTGHFCSSM